ncbi:MAG TPA: hypothetical protein VFM55_18910 [Micromonosporaceae bacterium]|nr:hypothetical protein [Micromonosporaceae bacterium]
MTSAELVALLDDVAATVRRHVEVVDDPQRPTVTVTATPGDGQVLVGWSIAPESAAEQVTGWLVGRDGTDTSGAGPWSATELPEVGSRIFRKLRAGQEYTFTVRALLADGATAEGSAKATPRAPTPGPTPGPVPALVPLVGKSGLPFNSIVFRRTPADADTFGRWRGRRADGLMWFTRRQTWADFRQDWAGKAAYLDAGHLVVTRICHAPTAEGAAMNTKGAADAYRQQQRDLGAYLASQGLNHPLHVLSVDWEFNGDWYPWSARNGGAAALKASLRNCITNLRAGGLTRVLFGLCGNKGPSQSGVGIAEVTPGREYVDVYGVDAYDHWQAAFTAEQWRTETARDPGLATVRALAARDGVMWSHDEGGNSHGPSGGGDNPAYWEFLWQFLTEDPTRLAWHTTYDDRGAPGSLRHDFAANPKSTAAYLSHWGAGSTVSP